MAIGMVRMNCEGLLAVAIKDTSPVSASLVQRIDLIFLDPDSSLPAAPAPEKHRPRLEVEDANLIDWSRTSLPYEPNVTPLSFPLTGWRVEVRSDDKAPSGEVQWPGNVPDPDAGGMLSVLSNQYKLLDLKTICGEGTLDPKFLQPQPEVLGTLALETGRAFTMSLNTGAFEEWGFEGSCTKHQTAEALALFVDAEEFVTFQLTSIADATKTAKVTVGCKGRLSRIKLKHTCRLDNPNACKQHRGNHVAQYYKMTQPLPTNPPKPIPPHSDSGYCPPALFDQA